MIRSFLITLLMGSLCFGQSILLAPRKARVSKAHVKKPRNSHIDFVEFREATMGNVLSLIRKHGGLKTQYEIDMSSEVNLRLVDTSWPKLQNTVLEEARPLEKTGQAR